MEIENYFKIKGLILKEEYPDYNLFLMNRDVFLQNFPLGDVHSILNEEEIAYGNQCLLSRKTEYLITRYFLRLILKHEFNLPSYQFPIATTKNGKPKFLEPSSQNEWNFNLSHTKTMSLFVLSKIGEIGCDIEYKKGPLLEESSLFCAPEELEFLQSLPASEQNDFLYQIWTKKESFLKAAGTGFQEDPRDHCVLKKKELNLQDCSYKLSHFSKREINFQEYYLAVCTQK